MIKLVSANRITRGAAWIRITITVLALSGCYVEACYPANQTQTELGCLKEKNLTKVDLSCPPNGFEVILLSVRIYRGQSNKAVGCPSTLDPTSTQCSDITTSYVCNTDNACSLTFPVSSDSSLGDLCLGDQEATSDPPNLYVVIVYTCQPEFSYSLNGTATAIALDDSSTVMNSLIHVNSHALGLMGVYITQTSFYCSAFIPGNAEMLVQLIFLDKKSSDQHPQCVNVAVQDGLLAQDQIIRSFCSISDAALRLPCSTFDRYLRISYYSNSPDNSIIFVLKLQVSYLSKITIQCGTPPFPLSLMTSTSSSSTLSLLPRNKADDGNKEPVAEEQSGNGLERILIIVLTCAGAALIFGCIIIIVLVLYCHRSRNQHVRHQPLSETPSLNSLPDKTDAKIHPSLNSASLLQDKLETYLKIQPTMIDGNKD